MRFEKMVREFRSLSVVVQVLVIVGVVILVGLVLLNPIAATALSGILLTLKSVSSPSSGSTSREG